MPSIDRLQEFVHFVQDKLKGDEKSESQIFLDRFFRAFGHEGAMEAGATYEARIKKGSKTGKTGYADLVWKPRVLIEMKKRGADLAKHYSQAFDYWQRAVPDRPRYVLLCNFDEFWVYDFDTQIDTPIDMVPLADLSDRRTVFGFMEITERKSVFGNNQVEVTEKAAGRMGELYAMLRDRLTGTGLLTGDGWLKALLDKCFHVFRLNRLKLSLPKGFGGLSPLKRPLPTVNHQS